MPVIPDGELTMKRATLAFAWSFAAFFSRMPAAGYPEPAESIEELRTASGMEQLQKTSASGPYWSPRGLAAGSFAISRA
jgi:hypothetical protein